MHTFIHLLKTSVTHSTHPEQYRHLQEDEAMAPLLQDTQGSREYTLGSFGAMVDICDVSEIFC